MCEKVHPEAGFSYNRSWGENIAYGPKIRSGYVFLPVRIPLQHHFAGKASEQHSLLFRFRCCRPDVCSPSLFFLPFPYLESFFKRAHLEPFFKKCACVFMSRSCRVRLKQIARSSHSERRLGNRCFLPPLPFHRSLGSATNKHTRAPSLRAALPGRRSPRSRRRTPHPGALRTAAPRRAPAWVGRFGRRKHGEVCVPPPLGKFAVPFNLLKSSAFDCVS